jgi:uncharacterized membrane protein
VDTILKQFAEYVAMGCELIAVAVIAAAALEAVAHFIRAIPKLGNLHVKKAIWLRFASSILLSLEFALAADIARTAIRPTWNELGQLAAIAAIRTFLNIYLEKDLDSAMKAQGATPGG